MLALANGVKSGGERSHWQSAFVRAIGDLDPQHLDLVERFTWTRVRLGLDFGNEDVLPYLMPGKSKGSGRTWPLYLPSSRCLRAMVCLPRSSWGAKVSVGAAGAYGS